MFNLKRPLLFEPLHQEPIASTTLRAPLKTRWQLLFHRHCCLPYMPALHWSIIFQKLHDLGRFLFYFFVNGNRNDGSWKRIRFLQQRQIVFSCYSGRRPVITNPRLAFFISADKRCCQRRIRTWTEVIISFIKPVILYACSEQFINCPSRN